MKARTLLILVTLLLTVPCVGLLAAGSGGRGAYGGYTAMMTVIHCRIRLKRRGRDLEEKD